MSTVHAQSCFDVGITVEAAGPVRRRTKHKRHKLLRAEATIQLPFVPYPGLYLTFSQPKKRGEPLKLYLRIRAVEWEIAEQQFQCVADEMLCSILFSETYEVRGCARIEEHFQALEKSLREFGFKVNTDVDGMLALHKCADGTLIDPASRT